MLDELIVNNLGIIDEAHLEPGPGFVAITGETGAGKTMLLGALRLLMGTASRRASVGPFGDEAAVDGRFMFAEGDEVTLRRRVTSEGRSRAYVDGSMVPARALLERTAGRIEVVGQHDHMLLATANGARQLVDSALSPQGQKAQQAYEAAWQLLVETRQKIELLGGSRRELERELEIVQFQADEIGAAGFAGGDDAELAKRATRLRSAEDLATGLGSILSALGDEGAQTSLTAAAAEFARLARLDSELDEASDRLEEISGALGELQMDLASIAAGLEHEPGELDTLEDRIQLLGNLRRKYGENLDEVLAFGDAASQRAAELEDLLGTAGELDQELDAAALQASAAAAVLHKHRAEASSDVAKKATLHLVELGMSAPIVRFDFRSTELGPTGADRIELAFASDKGLTPGPAAQIASGGELSRLTLALRLAAGVGDASLLAFDEVDAGIGGATALAMGEKLAALGVGRQLFCVTHLPQVAAHAETHYVVERDGSKATVRRIDGDDRLEELSRMLGGLADSERGQLHAAELLAAAQRHS